MKNVFSHIFARIWNRFFSKKKTKINSRIDVRDFYHLDLDRTDADGKLIEACAVDLASCMNALYDVDMYKEKYPLLSSIDPYGDTEFSFLQRKIFIKELQSCLLESRMKRYEKEIQCCIDFLKRIKANERLLCFGD